MDETQTARVLAARLPKWTIWFGEHTRSFWAVSRSLDLRAAPHIEAPTAEELERRAKAIERHFCDIPAIISRPVFRPSSATGPAPGRHVRRRRRTAGASS